MVIWYEDHKNRCPYEPHLSELDPTFGLYTTAVWQCEAGHRYFQDLHSPLKPLSDSENESDDGEQGAAGILVSQGSQWAGWRLVPPAPCSLLCGVAAHPTPEVAAFQLEGSDP